MKGLWLAEPGQRLTVQRVGGAEATILQWKAASVRARRLVVHAVGQ